MFFMIQSKKNLLDQMKIFFNTINQFFLKYLDKSN